MSSAKSDNNVPTLLYTCSVIFSVIPMIAVGLRFQARRRTQSRLFWDDWTILVSLLSCVTIAILIIIGVSAGAMGRHLKLDANGKPIYDQEYVIFQKMNYGIDLAQLLALGPTKASVLLLYRRIFGVDGRRFNIISMTLIAVVIAWTITFFFTNAFQYTPVDSMWTPKAHLTFKHSTRMFLAQSYFDVALDVTIISLPIPLSMSTKNLPKLFRTLTLPVWKLHMTLRRKMQISGIFLLGALTTGASIARTVVQYGVAREFDSHNIDKTYYLAPIVYWPLIEAALGIVAACLPLLRPIGQIYSVRNMILVSKKALSTIFTASSRRSLKSTPGYASNDTETNLSDRLRDPSQSDKWLKLILAHTVDHESRIEADPMTIPSGEVGGSGIKYERRYEVSYGSKET
ncbi:hypothetical protein M434DRAFT_31514 [Hypoxylon sp. CO27-5]|nr:hypothetical protein M434DRAFT_31514 [Hypoxylon sp. CO27-5]